MNTVEAVRFYALAVASGVLLGSLGERFLPVYGIAAVYIVGDLGWSALRKIAPHPDRDRS